MLEILVVVVVAVLVLANGGWDWIKAHFPQAQAQAQAVADKVVKDLSPVKEDAVKLGVDIHAVVDNWVALCKVPDIANDPEAVKAMDVLKSKILASAMPKPQQ